MKKILKKQLNNGFFLYFIVQKANKIFPGKYFCEQKANKTIKY